MNLSTAQSGKRAKEVGVRKVVGSVRRQLVSQFFTESFLVVMVAFIFSILLVQLFQPWFNEVADKKISLASISPSLWLSLIAFIISIAIVSGSYPAFYLSSFKPIKVLKGTFRVGAGASTPRKALVVVQFTVSIALIIGTIVVYQQIQHAKNRPIGYELNGLITIPIKTQEVKKNYEILRNDLLSSGMISEVSTSETTVTNLWWSDSGFEWKGKDPNLQDNIFRGSVDFEFGKTVGWKIKEGRDFSRQFPSDSTAMILNESAAAYMGFENPLGEKIKAYGRTYTVIGVVEDMVTQSLYQPVGQTFFIIDPFQRANFINVKINPGVSTTEALGMLSNKFVKYNSETPFEYNFANDEFAQKFYFEERIGKLVAVFAVLAVLISCLGLFGLASFVAAQRTKEIGIRKILGASIVNLWAMLSKEFAFLVIISTLIAIPMSYYYLDKWLTQYEYAIDLEWWIFVAAGSGALVIALFTVSFQTIKASVTNPVKNLRSE